MYHAALTAAPRTAVVGLHRRGLARYALAMSGSMWKLSGGRCALHGAVGASTCERCGDYTCAACTDYGTHTFCPSCRERVGRTAFPLTREDTHFASVFSVAWSTFTAHWVPLTLGALIYYGISFAFGICSNVLQQVTAGMSEEAAGIGALGAAVMGLVQNLVLAAAALGLIHMCQVALDGRAPSPGQLFSQGSRFFPWLGQLIVVGAMLGAPLVLLSAIALGAGVALDSLELGLVILLVLFVLLLVPLFYVGLGIYVGQFELIYDRTAGPIQALKRSWRLADGHRFTILAVSFAGGLLMAASVLALCVGIVPGTAFFYLLIATLHRGLRNGAGIPEPARAF